MHQISHLDLMIYLMAGMAVCCFVAVFAQPIRALVQGFFAIFYHPLNAIMENTRNAFQRIWNWVRVQLRGESSREGESPLYFVIGAVLYSALFFIFALCDLGLIILTLEAMGFHPAKYKIYDSSTLTAAVLVSCALFWGSILTDLIGWTHLGPWRRYSSPRLQKVLLGLSLAIVVLTISIGVGLAYWRMVNLTETEVSSASAEVNTSTYLDQGRGEISGQGAILGGETSQNETLANYEIKGTPFANFVFLTAPAAIAGLSLASTVPAG